MEIAVYSIQYMLAGVPLTPRMATNDYIKHVSLLLLFFAVLA